MNFEFDPGKHAIRKAKHGIRFEAAERLRSVAGVEADLGIVHGEYRYARLGSLADRVYIAIFTYRAGPAIRLISACKATAKEVEFYEQNKK